MNLNKLHQDIFYRSLYDKTKDESLLTRAGFFEDKLTKPCREYYQLNFLTTPLDTIRDNLQLNDTKENIVLLSTGGFAPLHQGHLDMFKLAKENLSDKGYNVLGGYISPSHDSYVLTKYNNSIKLTINERITLAQKLVNKSAESWISIDPWEGKYTPCAINFTDVIIRLEEYLNLHLKPKNKIKVAYLFGSDNSDFTWAFIDQGISVCVKREHKEVSDKTLSLSSNRHIFIENPHESKALSSSFIRNNEIFETNINSLPYLIRQESPSDLFQKTIDEESYKIFFKSLQKSIANSLSNTKVKILSLNEQRESIKNMDTNKSISLDPFITGKYSLAISRKFELSSSQIFSDNLINRPGSPSFNEQLLRIPSNESYTLIEDDIGSGGTLRKILSLLKDKNITINNQIILTHLLKEKDHFDIVDGRDFLIGSFHGGLVCSLPSGEIIRAPYIAPYVNLVTRAKIPPTNEMSLTIEIIKLNISFYQVNNHLKLGDSEQSFQTLMAYIGFSPEDSLLKICQWHLTNLLSLTGAVHE